MLFNMHIDKYDYWKTALGISAIDIELAEKMGIPFDTLSQANEHSAEVILPYIQYVMGTDMKILPISFGAQNFANSEILAKIIYKACKELNRNVLFIASSDFNHFAAPQAGKDLDDYALQALLSYDCQEFDKRVHERNISICGFGTIMTLYNFAKEECGHFKIKILRQGHSGEAIPMDAVVDYISILFYTDK